MDAFSDGVMAVVITIMVLNLRPPNGQALHDLRRTTPWVIRPTHQARHRI